MHMTVISRCLQCMCEHEFNLAVLMPVKPLLLCRISDTCVAGRSTRCHLSEFFHRGSLQPSTDQPACDPHERHPASRRLDAVTVNVDDHTYIQSCSLSVCRTIMSVCLSEREIYLLTRMWANAQRDGRPAEYSCTLCSTDTHY